MPAVGEITDPGSCPETNVGPNAEILLPVCALLQAVAMTRVKWAEKHKGASLIRACHVHHDPAGQWRRQYFGKESQGLCFPAQLSSEDISAWLHTAERMVTFGKGILSQVVEKDAMVIQGSNQKRDISGRYPRPP